MNRQPQRKPQALASRHRCGGRVVPPLGSPPAFTLTDEKPEWQWRRHDDIDMRKAVAVLSAFLIGLAVGLLVMRAAVEWGWLS